MVSGERGARFSSRGVGGQGRLRSQFKQGSVAFGPQHPAAHGILKLQMQLQGEVLRWVDPQFGFLHRGSEKLAEGRSLLQALPYFDRFDYVANLFQEHAYCLAIEELQPAPSGGVVALQLVRLFFDELSRILNHLLTLSATALDLSAMGPIFWAFEEREAVMELCEQASGARMHTALYRPHSFDFSVLTAVFLREVGHFLTRCARSLAGAFLGLLNNRSLKSRLSYVGQVSAAKAQAYGVTGIVARSSGVVYDLRLQGRLNYGLYRSFALRVFLGRRGDNLDRFLLRVKEVAEAFRLLSQVLAVWQPAGRPAAGVNPDSIGGGLEVVGRRPRPKQRRYSPQREVGVLFRPHGGGLQPDSGREGCGTLVGGLGVGQPRTALNKFTSMEALITHFRAASEGVNIVRGWGYAGVESPKGEVGVTLVGAGSGRPYRVKLRTPVSHNMHLIPTVSAGATFADFVATFCSLDIVMGEIDR